MSPKGRPEGEYRSAKREGTPLTEVAEQVPSPCISVCVMDPDGTFCLGCFRTLDEIAAWGTLDPDAKRRVLALLPAREASRRLR